MKERIQLISLWNRNVGHCVLGYGEGEQFVFMHIVHCGRDVSATKIYIDLMSQLLSAVSTDAVVICCGGSSADLIKALDRSHGRKSGVQYLFTLTPVQIEWLLYKPSFSVMRRFDM